MEVKKEHKHILGSRASKAGRTKMLRVTDEFCTERYVNSTLVQYWRKLNLRGIKR